MLVVCVTHGDDRGWQVSDSLADRHSHQGVDTRRDATARGMCKLGEDCAGVKVLKQHTELVARLYTANFVAWEFYYLIHW